MRALFALALVAVSACAHQGAVPAPAQGRALRARGARGLTDPTVRGARVLPEKIDEDRALGGRAAYELVGAEPGGGVRAIAGGVRVVSLPNGAMLASDERLPSAPSLTVAVPERLGGGFLFVYATGGLGSTVWRADRWLAEARPIARWESAVHKVVFGLDRVYLRASNGAVAAIDGRTGERLDLGPWPGSSYVGAYAAADGWRAVAIDDLRGAVATFDAGATWRPLALPMDVKDVRLLGDAIAVGGVDAARETSWYEVRPDGQVGRLGAMLAPQPAAREEKADGAPRPLGKRPLLAAIEDGWPLDDGTALVARDGGLSRVRLADGALVDHAPDAFPLRPSRCHPVSLAAPEDAAAFGFVCGEVHGPTVVYAYDAARGALTTKLRFERPRAVLAFGNGALAVRGTCDRAADDPGDGAPLAPGSAEHADDKPAPPVYCVVPRAGAPYPVSLTKDGDRVVVLADGRVAIVSPPPYEGGTARLIVRGARGRDVVVPLAFRGKDADRAAPLAADVAHALRFGVWLDGFEERRPGVLGGWIDAGGAVLGVEITLDGDAVHGPFIRDAGAPMVSGRYGLGWSASRRGVETTDGGMTWTPLDLPEPLVPPRGVSERACGPIGCTAGGWLRVGWGPSKRDGASIDVPPAVRAPPPHGAPALELTCEALAPPPPALPERMRPAPSPLVLRGAPIPWNRPALAQVGAPNADLPAFYASAPPTMHADERGISAEASERVERHPHTGPLAQVYAIGPRTGEWEHASRWLARWVWPFGGWNDVHASLPAPTPQVLLDSARFASGVALPVFASWRLGVGDDGGHALLVARRTTAHGGEETLLELEEGRAPVELRRADGEPFTEVDAVLRAGGRWYIATPPAREWTSVVWQVDGPVAREIARIPRAGMEVRPTGARLARRSDGRAIGYVVDGQPQADRAGPQRWVLPIDLETGALGDPEPLGAADLSDRDAVSLCAEDDAGWVLDTPWNLGVRVSMGPRYAGSLSSVDARVRITRDRACVERLAGTMGALDAEQAAALTRAVAAKPTAAGPTIPVVAISASSRTVQMRYPLRCARR